MNKSIFCLTILFYSVTSIAQTRYTSLCKDISCNSNTTYSFDLDGNGETDMRVTPGSGFGDLRYDQSYSNLGFLDYVVNGSGDAYLLDKNQLISDTSNFSYQKSSKHLSSMSIGDTNKYIGLRYTVSGSSAYFYGWMEVSFLSSNSMIVHSFGFSKNAGDSILAGDISNVIAISVTNIKVTSQSDNYAVNTNGGQLQMVATLTPVNPTNCDVTWSINTKGGGATIDQNGLLTANKTGLIDVVATAKDGSGTVGQVEVEVSPIANIQTFTTDNILIYPNPAKQHIIVKMRAASEYQIYQANGQVVQRGTLQNESPIDITTLTAGTMYYIKLTNVNGDLYGRFVKE